MSLFGERGIKSFKSFALTPITFSSEDTGKPPDEKKYPFITALFSRGIERFLEIAVTDFGYHPGEEYETKCHLCFGIRRFLTTGKDLDSPELKPGELYDNIDF